MDYYKNKKDATHHSQVENGINLPQPVCVWKKICHATFSGDVSQRDNHLCTIATPQFHT